jgi:flagellar protein FlgJ
MIAEKTMTTPIQPATTGPPQFAVQSAAGNAIQSQGKALEAAQQTERWDPTELREAFDDFVGQTFFSQMLSAMRKTVDKPAYFHGGRTEEIFQSQLDQALSEELSEAAASTFTDPMFELFTLQRQ